MWAPIDGAQTAALESDADFLFYGGAAGGGKTDLLLGAALTQHHRSIIFRREYEQLKGVKERGDEIVGQAGTYSGKDKFWRLDDSTIKVELGGVQHPGDETNFQGRPHDLKAFDELPQFTEHMFRFLCGWLRTTNPNQRCRVIGAGNPPTDAEGEWVIRFWGPWLDPEHPNPAEPGELRWFAVLDGKDVEVAGPEPFKHGGHTIKPKSRTFIPARVEDNPYYMATDYVSTLQALPEPLRSMLLEGRFDTGREDNPWQIVPTEWVKAAQARWEASGGRPRGVPMTAVGVDIAQGGEDETVLSPRYAQWFAEQLAVAGRETPDGPSVAALVVAKLRDGAQANIDCGGGWGGDTHSHLKENGVATVALNGSEKSDGRDRSGKLGFYNKRAEWYWQFRQALDPEYGEDLALPPDPQMRSDICAARWQLTSRGIKVEDKAEIIKRIGRSPDRGEAAIYSLADESQVVRRRKARKHTWSETERGYNPLSRSQHR